MNPIIFETQFNESGSRVYFMRLGRLYQFRTENRDLEYISTTSICIDKEVGYFSLNESLGICFVAPRPPRNFRIRSMASPVIVRFDLLSKEIIDSKSYGNKDLRRISMNRNYIALVFRSYIKIYHAYNFNSALQKFDTADNPEGVVSLAHKRDILAFPTPGPPGGITILKMGGAYLRKQEWARVIRATEKDRWLRVKLSRNGNYVAAVSTRGSPVRVFEVRTSSQIYEFKIKNPQKRILDLEFGPSNKYLAVLCPQTLYIFRITKLLEPLLASSPKPGRNPDSKESIQEGDQVEPGEERREKRIEEEPVEPIKPPSPKTPKKSSAGGFFSLFGGGGKKSLIAKHNFRANSDYPVSVRFSREDETIVMVTTKKGTVIYMKFEYDMSSKEKRKLGYPVGDGPVRVSERTIEDCLSSEQIYLSSLGIIAKEKSDENEFALRCIARRDTQDDAPQIKPTEVIVNQNTGQTVEWLANIIRIRLNTMLEEERRKGEKKENDSGEKKTEKLSLKEAWDTESEDEEFYRDDVEESESSEDEGEEGEDDDDDDDDLGFEKPKIVLGRDEDAVPQIKSKKKRRRKKKKIYIFANGELQDYDEELYRLFQKYREKQHPRSRPLSGYNSAEHGLDQRAGQGGLRFNELQKQLRTRGYQEEEEENSDVMDEESSVGSPNSRFGSLGGFLPSSPPLGELSGSPVSSSGLSDEEFGRVKDLPENTVTMKQSRILKVYYSYVHQPASFVHISSPQKMPIRLSRHSSNLIDSEKGFIFGGVHLSRGKFRLTSHLYSVELMDRKVMDIERVHLGLYGTTAPCRYSHCSFFDPLERNLYIFGGSDDRSFSGDLYRFSLNKKKWDKVECKGTIPHSRIDSGFVFRKKCRKAILWGGFVGSLRQGEYCNELYELDMEHMRWNKFFRLTNDLIPVGRSKHFLRLYSDENKMLLHGGFHDFQPCYDTWSYDFDSHLWRRLSIMATFPNPLTCQVFRRYMVTVSDDLERVHLFDLTKRCWKRVYIVAEENEKRSELSFESEKEKMVRRRERRKRIRRFQKLKKDRIFENNFFSPHKKGIKVGKGSVSLSMASSLTNNKNVIYIFGGETRDRRSTDSYYIVDFSRYKFE